MAQVTFWSNKYWNIGVTADAKLTLKVNKNTPSLLYYKLNAIETNENKLENKQIVVDNEVDLNNQLIVKIVNLAELLKLPQQDLLHLHMI